MMRVLSARVFTRNRMKPLPAWLVIRKIEKEALGTPREMMTEVDHETKDFNVSACRCYEKAGGISAAADVVMYEYKK